MSSPECKYSDGNSLSAVDSIAIDIKRDDNTERHYIDYAYALRAEVDEKTGKKKYIRTLVFQRQGN